MKSRVAKAIAVLVLVAAAGAFYQWRQSEPKATAALSGPPPGVPVTVAEVVKKTVPLKLNVVGRAEAYSTVTLRPRIEGQIMSIEYKPGDRVRKGQVMVLLDPRILQAQVRQAEANLARDRAQLDKASSDVQRYTDLLAKGFVSAAQLEAFKSTEATLAATLNANQAQLDLTRTQLSYTRIEAPMDGVAGAVLAYPGSMVKANETNLVIINQVVPIYVSFNIPESQLREITRVQGAKPFVVEARIPGQGRETTSGELVFVDNAVDATTGTILLKGLFKNEKAQLTPGQFVEVSMTLRMLDDALLMPSEALQTGPQGTFVYVAKPDNTVEVRKLATTPIDDRTVLVNSGLAAGERVVTDGQLRLTPGARIEVRPSRMEARSAS